MASTTQQFKQSSFGTGSVEPWKKTGKEKKAAVLPEKEPASGASSSSFSSSSSRPTEKKPKFHENKYGDESKPTGHDKDENDYHEEDTEDEKAARSAFLHQGRVANAKKRNNGQSKTRPESIEKHWKSLYVLVKI
jgi:hypothetical protein